MRLTIHLPDELARFLRQAAANEGRSMSALTAEAVALYFQEKKRKALGLELLKRAGQASVDARALEVLDEGRADRP